MFRFLSFPSGSEAKLECLLGRGMLTRLKAVDCSVCAHQLVSRSKPSIVPEMRLFGVANPQLMN
jgi:hypothetical protein